MCVQIWPHITRHTWFSAEPKCWPSTERRRRSEIISFLFESQSGRSLWATSEELIQKKKKQNSIVLFYSRNNICRSELKIKVKHFSSGKRASPTFFAWYYQREEKLTLCCWSFFLNFHFNIKQVHCTFLNYTKNYINIFERILLS